MDFSVCLCIGLMSSCPPKNIPTFVQDVVGAKHFITSLSFLSPSFSPLSLFCFTYFVFYSHLCFPLRLTYTQLWFHGSNTQ